jgi:hypothetical protein
LIDSFINIKRIISHYIFSDCFSLFPQGAEDWPQNALPQNYISNSFFSSRSMRDWNEDILNHAFSPFVSFFFFLFVSGFYFLDTVLYFSPGQPWMAILLPLLPK